MANLAQLETATKQYADERELLTLRVEDLKTKIEALKRKHLAEIRACAERTANARQALEGLIDESRELFVKPRTIIISGIKIGLQKGKGKIEISDETAVINQVRKHIPVAEQALYIETVEKVIRKNLIDLPVATLMKLGVKVSDTDDQVVIKATGSDVDKLVSAMLAEAGDEAQEWREAA